MKEKIAHFDERPKLGSSGKETAAFDLEPP
jgi:hypothetical protein